MKYDPQQIRDMVETLGLSLSEVARQLGAKVSVISKLCKRHSIVSKHNSKAERKQLPISSIYADYASGVSLHRLAIDNNVPISTIKRHLKTFDHGIQFRTRDEALRPGLLNDKTALEEALKEHSCRSIAKQLKVKVRTVTAAVRRHKLTTHLVTHQLAGRSVYDKLYVIEELSPRAIGKILSIPYNVVLRQLRKYGYQIAKAGGRPRQSKHWQLNDSVWLASAYRQKGLMAIATEIGTSIGNVVYHLRKYKVVMRSKEEWLKLLADQHGNRRSVAGIECDSDMEARFISLLPIDQKATVARGPQLEHAGSSCLVDFVVGGDHVEIKSRDQSEAPGPNRRRLVKQWLVCDHHGIDLKVWNGKFYDFQITDLDKYYCINWKLLFKSHQDCADWLLAFGYRGVEYANTDLADGLKKVVNVKPGHEFDACFRNEDSVKLIKHFSQHYWASARRDHLPVSAIWQSGNTVVLRKAIETLWGGSREVNLYGLIRLVQKSFKDFLSPSIFKPWVANNLYKKLLPNGGTVVDPCMGWGGRLLGCCDLPIKYVGIDINESAIVSHRNLYKFCKSRLACEPDFLFGDSTTMSMPAGDLLIASPPYDDIEEYAGSARTSLMAVVDNIFATFNGMVALNVPVNRRDEVIASGVTAGYRLVDEIKMVTATLFRHQEAYEPILVFRR